MMSEPGRSAADLAGLVAAVRKNRSKDGIGAALQERTWKALANYLQPLSVAPQQVLIQQGAADRSLYFVESGMLRIYRSDHNTRLQLAVLGAGAVVGEGTFFAPIVRNASAEAAEPSTVWELGPAAFTEMLAQHTSAACEVAMALGAVMAIRTLTVAGRLAIT